MSKNDRVTEDFKVIPSSGNVFADLGLAEPELALAKAKLAFAISRAIEARALTESEAGELSGLDQPRISAITRGRLSGISLDQLFRTLNALGQDVEVFVQRSDTGGEGRLTVTVDSISS